MPILPLLAASAWLAIPGQKDLDAASARFAPVEVTADLSTLPPEERKALARLVAAGRIMDALFLEQVWAGNPSLLGVLAADGSPLGRSRLHAFLLNKGPWSRLDGEARFLPGVPAEKPPQASFYPPGATKAEIEAWIGRLSPPDRERATGFYWTIRRGPDGALAAVPYSVEYQGPLAEAARLLREAAGLTKEPTLKAFLEQRARAFLDNDYRPSDEAWIDVDGRIEPTIGPYEVYEDGWFNYKAAFEAFIGVRDEAETRKLASLSSRLQEIENALPIADALKNPRLAKAAPIRVVDEIYCSGDAAKGVQTAAYNLPNDERILAEKGAKRVMLRNVQQAKFEKTLRPIAAVALAPADRRDLSFDAFFTHILMHELMHGLGPHTTASGVTVRQAMQEAGSALEEAKADVSGLFALQLLVDRGALPRELERTMYTTFLASAFRTLRFGLEDAHGRGMALQVNSLLDAGAFRVAPDGTFSVDRVHMRDGVTALTRRLMELQASGDAAQARKLLAELAVVRPEVKRVLERLTKVPVDIEPRFTAAAALLAELP
jgi:hypothetical protein